MSIIFTQNDTNFFLKYQVVICYGQKVQSANLPVLFLLTSQFRVVGPINFKFGREERTLGPCQNSSWSAQGCGPQNLKIWNFTNIIAPKGCVPCTILTKFSDFMRVLGLHNFDKFGWFSLITDKIINNLPRWGRFQPNFRWPLATKLLMGPKKV